MKIKKYFNFLKENRDKFVDLDYSYLKSQSQTAHESVIKVQEKIQGKLADSYENQDKKQQSQFDITKLESIKEKTNKNFFEKMENLKSTKKPGQTHKQPETIDNDDLLDLDAGTPNPNPKDDDLFNLEFGSSPKKQNTKPSNAYNDLDLLASNEKVSKPKNQDSDFLIDFQQDLSVSKPVERKNDNIINSDIFKGLNGEDGGDKKKESKAKVEDKDPFDFIAF